MDLETYRDGDAELQALYARWLDLAARAGFIAALATLILYLSGVPAPFVQPPEVAALWHLPAEAYRAASGAPEGWAWLALLAHGDYLAFAACALFAGVTLLCYLRVLPVLVARRDRIYAVIAAAQLGVLLATATLC